MKNRKTSHAYDRSATTSGAFSRREWMRIVGASALGGGLLGSASRPLCAQHLQAPAGPPIIDAHIHMWKLPRSLPPMSDGATYPGDPTDGFCCTINANNPSGAVPWLQRDALIADYLANWGGRRVSQVVLIESSVGTTPAGVPNTFNPTAANNWMLQTAAMDTNGPVGGSMILGVVGAVDLTQTPAAFAQQIMQLASNPLFVGIRTGDLPNSSIFGGASTSFANVLPQVLTNLKLMASLGLELDANMGPPGGQVLAQIGQATGIAIVMDHFAGEGNTFTPSQAWYDDMTAAATYPGCHVKVSDVETLSEAAVGGYTFGPSQFQPIADPTQYYPTMEFLWNTFGQNRLLWGSNWPVCRYGGILTDPVDFEINVWESFLAQEPEGRDQVMYKNSLRVYGPGSSSRI